ncbi:MAG TPA: sugar phosphate isomerase/epimerase, partial [Rhodanobacter sp.]|nr:sugar phosphate isomerase/epimerase [Rhodanobacter sp.]
EVKRALEAAEQVPFSAAVISLGLNHSAWDEAAIEHSLTAIEHLKAFAAPLGVRLLLANGENEVTTPEHLLYIVKAGHFDSVGVSLDVGHLHLAQDAAVAGRAEEQAVRAASPWVESAVTLLGARIAQVHLHDNHGAFSDSADMKDEHLWPGEGAIDWPAVAAALAPLPAATPGILDVAGDREQPADAITRRAEAAFRTLEEQGSVQAAK